MDRSTEQCSVESRPLTAEERHQVLVAWNDTRTSYPKERCIHELFEDQVRRTPDAIAVVFEGESLTYRQLNVRGNRLAHCLRRLGVGPETLVGLCIERSLEMIVGLLGILKAGGAYVPLDPSYPRERLAFMLQDTQALVLLTQQALVDNLPVDDQTVICLDSHWDAIAHEPDEPLGTETTSGYLAYVMYTSGSTGKPKGVSVTHRNVVRLVLHPNYAKLTADEVFLQFAPIAFDAATLEIWGALLNGGRLVVFPPGLSTLERLGETIQKQQITTLWLTAGLFHHMVDQQVDCLKGLRQLLAGGDVLSVVHVQTVLKALPECQLINGYGPTENTTFTTCHRLQAGVLVGSSVPIGRPVSNTQVYVLDEHLEPVAIGMIGELYTGGDGLARGYLNRPDLTAERFIPHPFSEEPGARLYKTGDLARYLPDGTIEFIGRMDHQVKIRGFRVELGEIEAVLSRHPAIRHAVVSASDGLTGERYLAAYVVTKQEPSPTTTELRTFLQEHLPDYMVPAVFVTLDALPLTRNGKVDRQALPAPDRARPALALPYVAPRKPTEEVLARICAEVLGLDQVGIHDNLFDLGAHSLGITQIVARVRHDLHVALPLNCVFEHPSVTALAKVIEQNDPEKSTLSLPAIPAIAQHGALPLAFAQERVWFVQQLHATRAAYNFQAIIRLVGRLDVAVLEQSLSDIVRRHAIYRTTFPTVDGQPVQVIHDAEPIRLSVVDLVPVSEAERESAMAQAVQEAMQTSFDLTQLPLVRWTLLRLGDTEHRLIHVEHHLVHDGWSFNVWLGELVQLYHAFSNGEPSPLPALPMQFADFAHWQRQWMASDEAHTQLTYWQKKLAGCPSLLELPTDRPRPARQSFQGAAPRVDLPVNLCEALRALSRQEGVTLYMTMLTAFVVLLWRYTGQDDLCVGSGIANRRWRETEGLIGMLVNNLVLRSDLSGNPSVRDLLAQVRETTLEAFAHQDLPFEKVVEAIQPARNLSHNPLFQVMFGFHDAPMTTHTLPDLEVSVQVGLSNGSCKFDLNVIVIPQFEQQVGLHPTMAEAAGLTLLWEYSTDLFDATTMMRMIGHYQTLLEGMVAHPTRRIADLPLVSDDERQQLLVRWNETTRAYPRQRCIHELFEAQVTRSPEASAVGFDEARLSNRELNRRANQLARHLRRLGVGPEVVVAICMTRCLEMLIGLLGILKAGGAYVPLDPAESTARLAFMLDDTQASVLLTQQRLAASLPSHALPTICLDTGWEVVAQECGENLGIQIAPENLAYVLYTSGSTGQPKGVMIAHGSLTNYLTWVNDCVLGDTVPPLPTTTRFIFDASLKQWFAPLLRGDEVWGLADHIATQPDALLKALQQRPQAGLNSVPILWQAILEMMACNGTPPSLQSLFVGGDRLDQALLERSFATLPHMQIWNLYGPTETTANAVVARLAPGDQVNIGRPIANTQVYVLDANLQPTPIGVPGELYIGGEGVARGYLRRPELTAERFVPHPFSDQPGARMYRTGDRVRYRPNGTLMYLGRMDDQLTGLCKSFTPI